MYRSRITDYGIQAMDFLQENMLILFQEGAPAELTEIAFLHIGDELVADIKVGDHIFLGEERYDVTAIGEKANETFRTMGHCTLRFDGADRPSLPGSIHLCGKKPSIINIDDRLEIIHR
ncbi:MAG: PTS glucitol/sorbitol transporter subunit IIA [Peptostreptococcaceae bacterium]|nr:PTS glucitol/sorbitol transporter subunit IIA [Peptostreptococcaceae bacterium]